MSFLKLFLEYIQSQNRFKIFLTIVQDLLSKEGALTQILKEKREVILKQLEQYSKSKDPDLAGPACWLLSHLEDERLHTNDNYLPPYFKKSINLNFIMAKVELGYYKTWNEKTESEGLKLLEEAEKQLSFKTFRYMMVRMYEKLDLAKKAFEMYGKMTKENQDAQAFHELADAYKQGEGVKKDVIQAKENYIKCLSFENKTNKDQYSQSFGFTEKMKLSKLFGMAHYDLANLYKEHNFVENADMNAKLILEHYERAAQLEYPLAYLALGHYFFDKNQAQSLSYFDKAIECIPEKAELCEEIGKLFHKKDILEAFHYYQWAAKKNRPEAMFLLAELLETNQYESQGIKQNLLKAAYLYQQCAIQSFRAEQCKKKLQEFDGRIKELAHKREREAESMMAESHYQNYLSPKLGYVEQIKSLKLAADQNHATAQVKLSMLLLKLDLFFKEDGALDNKLRLEYRMLSISQPKFDETGYMNEKDYWVNWFRKLSTEMSQGTHPAIQKNLNLAITYLKKSEENKNSLAACIFASYLEACQHVKEAVLYYEKALQYGLEEEISKRIKSYSEREVNSLETLIKLSKHHKSGLNEIMRMLATKLGDLYKSNDYIELGHDPNLFKALHYYELANLQISFENPWGFLKPLQDTGKGIPFLTLYYNSIGADPKTAYHLIREYELDGPEEYAEFLPSITRNILL